MSTYIFLYSKTSNPGSETGGSAMGGGAEPGVPERGVGNRVSKKGCFHESATETISAEGRGLHLTFI